MSHLPKRLILLSVFLVTGAGVFAEACQAQGFQYPPYGAQRGRMVARDGIGHSVRYRWGNGLTPTGGAVLMNAIDAFAPAVITLAGGSRDFEAEARHREAESRSRAAARSKKCRELAVAQERANQLLARTARLVDEDFTLAGSPGPSETDSQPPPPPESSATDFESDPWDDPSAANGSPSPGQGDVQPLGDMGTDPWDD